MGTHCLHKRLSPSSLMLQPKANCSRDQCSASRLQSVKDLMFDAKLQAPSCYRTWNSLMCISHTHPRHPCCTHEVTPAAICSHLHGTTYPRAQCARGMGRQARQPADIGRHHLAYGSPVSKGTLPAAALPVPVRRLTVCPNCHTSLVFLAAEGGHKRLPVGDLYAPQCTPVPNALMPLHAKQTTAEPGLVLPTRLYGRQAEKALL